MRQFGLFLLRSGLSQFELRHLRFFKVFFYYFMMLRVDWIFCREIQLTRDLHEKDALIEYYYMGYYIHSCPKMRYKGKLSMSDLLCPETYTWVPIEKCIPKLEVSKYSRLNDDLDAVDDAFCTFKDVDEIKVLVGYKFMDFGLYKKRKGGQKMFENIGTLIGKKCAKSLLFVISN